jgi:hypothetical protein
MERGKERKTERRQNGRNGQNSSGRLTYASLTAAHTQLQQPTSTPKLIQIPFFLFTIIVVALFSLENLVLILTHFRSAVDEGQLERLIRTES